MDKIIYIAPHLSTGGMPQYLLKQIQTFKDEFEIYCFEWLDIGGTEFVVQKDKIKKILGDRLISLNGDGFHMINKISEIKPDFIHFQEIPETFITSEILHLVYKANRDYSIFVTTHSSETDPSSLSYGADRFILVSDWSKSKFVNYYPDICDVWEYPIETQNYDKKEYMEKLSFDDNVKHVLHVGLFTPGKNQSHIFEVARKMLPYNIKFHFVGNMALNFKTYWKPMMDDKPENVIIHYERSNVYDFYKACDVFYFPSLFELNPIAVKEAISHKLPIFIKPLEVYQHHDSFTYLPDDIDECVKLLKAHFGFNDVKPKILHILTDIDSEREVKSVQNLSKFIDYGFDYIPIVNKRYVDMPPLKTCAYPEKFSEVPGNALTPAHYGCYEGHKKAFMSGLDSEYMLIFECDCVLDVTHEEFVNKINLAKSYIEKQHFALISFGYHNNSNIVGGVLDSSSEDDLCIVKAFYGAHAYLIHRKFYPLFIDIYNNAKWDTPDLFLSNNLSDYKIGVFKKPLTKQLAGFSILDKIYHDERY